MFPPLDIPCLYKSFDAPLTSIDCGQMCSPFHPDGLPYCCDICQAVPVVYRQEWQYLQSATGLWHVYRGDECPAQPADPAELEDETPSYMLLLACRGPSECSRDFRSISCRQFPFFPYITSRDRFIGLAYHWDFEPVCWVISNLWAVTAAFRSEFVHFYDGLFALWEEDFDSYAITSEDMRTHFSSIKRRIPLLHRNGGYYLLSPESEKLQPVSPERFKKFDPYLTPSH